MKKISKVLITFFAFVTVIFAGNISAEAAEFTLAADDTWVDGVTADEGVDFYYVTLKEAGYLKVITQSMSYSGSVAIKDKDLAYTYVSSDYLSGSEIDPCTKSHTLALDPGVYAIRLGSGSRSMTYRVKAQFEPADNTDSVLHNSFTTAEKLKLGKTVKGFLTEDEGVDFYKVTVTKYSTLRCSISTNASMYFEIYDSDFYSLSGSKAIYSGNTTVYEQKVSAGTYYIKIEAFYNNTGKYILKPNEWTYVDSIKLKKSLFTVDKGTTTSVLKSVSPSCANKKKLTWESSDTSVATVSSSGKVKAKKVGAALITAKTTDGSEITATCRFVVKPSKAQIKSCKLKTGLSAVVKVKAQNNVSGYEFQLSRNKAFKGKKSSYFTSSDLSPQTDTLKKQKQYYFRVRAYVMVNGDKYYGEWSDVKTLKTRKSGVADRYCLWKDA